ncbi:hypothetical protein EDB85DRAFT_2159789 [Lactarius pseudohatsudake]|nr:hypothetical protein EDB85DRAFT_2159789 [Lactarius pseudohatsudake]
MRLLLCCSSPVIDYNELAGSADIGTYPIDPSPSSLLPSGVSVETVARLMHDELLHNAEFAKQVCLVAALQELLKFCSKTTPNVVSPLRPDCSTQQVRVNSGDLPLPHPQPTIRPAHYPEKVQRTLADCKVNAEVNSSPGNLSRPPMLCAICCDDSTLPLNVTPYYKYFTEQVEKSNAKGAKKSGNKPGESTTQQAKVKKTLYKHFFFKEWFAALQELKSAVPLMSLCAGYWKANMTLGSVLPDIHVDLPTPATSHVGTSSCAATPSNASRAPHSQSSVPPPACSQSSRPPPAPRSQLSMPPPAPRSQSSMPPPTPHVRSLVPSCTTRPHPQPVASQPATPPSPFPTPSDSSRAAASHSEPSAHRDLSKAPQPSASCAPPAKKAGTKGKRRNPSPPPQSEKRRKHDDDTVPDVGRSQPASPRPAFLSIVKSGAVPLELDQQTSRTTRTKSAMQAGDHVTSGEEAGTNNVAARQWESSPLPPSHPTTPKPKCVSSVPTTPYMPASYEESQDLDQDNGNGDDKGDKHGDGESGSGDGDSDGLLATLKHDVLIAWITAHDIEPQGKRATKKEIIKAIMAATKSEHPSKEDVEEIIESRQAKRNTRTA